MKEAFRRIGKSLKFSFEESVLKKRLDDLRDRNDDLRVLVTQLGKFKQTFVHCEQGHVVRKALPIFMKRTRIASTNLHGALRSAWHCTDSSHTQHTAGLCVDVQSKLAPQLNIAIWYNETDARPALR